MAPSRVLALLAPRQTLSSGDDTTSDSSDSEYCSIYGCYSSWDNWGRWVALVVIIIAVLLIAFAFSCIKSRRRRRQGMAPMYGTGWMAGKPPSGGQHYYGPNQYYGNQTPYGQPAPPYSPQVGNQMTGNTFNSNEGYYGHHGGDYELQQPQTAYQPQRGGDPVYDAPEGPPPKKV